MGNSSTFRHKFFLKIPFSAHKNIPDHNNSWYCTIDCKKFINDQLLTLNKEVCHENGKCIYRKKCHLTLTNNLDLHNFLIIIESGSLFYWIQHTKLYIWGKSHALIIFWKLPLISAAKQLDYLSDNLLMSTNREFRIGCKQNKKVRSQILQLRNFPNLVMTHPFCNTKRDIEVLLKTLLYNYICDYLTSKFHRIACVP